jgi:hypothetical protein
MDISYLSLIIFILSTIFYYSFLKPKIRVEELTQESGLNNYYSLNMRSLGLYLLIVVVSQFLLNVSYLINKCGGNPGKNVGAAALFTFIPWVLIFGIMIAVLIIFPGFKTAFSDVIGYFIVSNTANNILSELLIDTDVNRIISKSTNEEEKTVMMEAAEAIMKIVGNKSILINQMNIDSFTTIWDTLRPLMKPGGYEDLTKKQGLLDAVILKDNIGESIWYVYTAILVSSIVYYNLAMRGCVKDIEDIKANREKYLKEQEEINKKKELNEQTTYII